MSTSHSELDDQDWYETVEFDAIYLGKFLVHSFGQLFRAYHIWYFLLYSGSISVEIIG